MAGGDASTTASDAYKQRLNAQAEALQKSKLNEAARAGKTVQSDAARQGQAIDEKLKAQHKQVEDFAKGNTWMYGTELMRNAADVRKQKLSAEAQAEKEKIEGETRRKVQSQSAAARKSAEGVQQSVEGLNSQVGKEGKFGLQQKGSNLHVRQYGKN